MTFYEQINANHQTYDQEYVRLMREREYAAAQEYALKGLDLCRRTAEMSCCPAYIKETYRRKLTIWEERLDHVGRRTTAVDGGADGDSSMPEIRPEENVCKIRFSDVAGLQEAKDTIRYRVIEPLKDPEIARKYGVFPSCRLLLYGEPGTGKTTFARAVCGELGDWPFFFVNCADIVSKYLGESSRHLKAVMEAARRYEHACVFFDEFDALAAKRGDGTSGGDAEMARVVSTLLTEVDGFRKDPDHTVLLLAATNRPWVIDHAATRGGRFDQQIYVGPPDQAAREIMVNNALGQYALADDVNLKIFAERLSGIGGGDISSICERIRLKAYRRHVDLGRDQVITRQDCDDAFNTYRPRVSREDAKKLEAYRKNGDLL